MKACGLIVEYNPFHYGHKYHIDKAKELTKADVIIAIMSPTFMQRGEPAIIDKYTRTKTALENGIDIVVELPSIYAIQSANHFANGALKLLNEMKINYLVFGSESDDLTYLKKAAEISTTSEYQGLVKKYVKDGQRYANACNQAFKEYNIPSIDSANDILGLAYLQEIEKNNYHIEALSIKRNTDFLATEPQNDFASASAIRKMLYDNTDTLKYTPMANVLEENRDKLVFLDDLFLFLKYQLTINNNISLSKIHGFDEGIEFLFINNINKSKSIKEFIDLCTSKRYPKTRIQRAIVYLLTNFTKDDNQSYTVDYLRILGFSKKGQEYLKKIKNKTSYKIITTFSNHESKSLDFEMKISNIYALLKEDKINKFIDLSPVIIFE